MDGTSSIPFARIHVTPPAREIMLTGKTAIVTGASSGIGASLATLLAGEGMSVVVAARHKERLEDVGSSIRKAGGSCLVMPCDVTDRRDAETLIQRTIDSLGRIDVLVNNAGRGHFASVEETTDETIQNMFAVNAFALWYTSRPAIRQMKKQRSGHIINVASIAGKIGFPFNSAYVAAKHACVGFTHGLRMELVGTGIHASVVCPAGVLTDWANKTEGGPMTPLFSGAAPIAREIARERRTPLPAIQSPIEAGEVAGAILSCILHPVAEVFTHEGEQEFVVLAARSREQAEEQMMPMVLAEQSVYRMLKEKHDDRGRP